MVEAYYFGCWGEVGHYLRAQSGRSVGDYNMPADFPCPLHVLDSGFLPPREPETEGRVHRVRFDGWTVIAFWDRSVDSRGKGNSAFVIRGELSTDEAIRAAREAFPQVFARFKFEVKAR